MKQIKHLFILLVALVVVACDNDGYTDLPAGASYKFIEKGEGKKPGAGEVMLVHMENVVGDSVIMRTQTKDGLAFSPDQGPDLLTEAFKLCGEGDSLHIRISLGQYSFLTRTAFGASVDTSEIVTMKLKVHEVANRQAFVERKQREAEEMAKEQLETDISIIEKYLADNNLVGTKTDEGVYYVIEKQGRGKKPNNGDLVGVSYTVRLLDGTFIDTSDAELSKQNNAYNPGRPYGPYKFKLGTRAVIAGWDIGIAKINQGTKAKLLVPSALAYGPSGNSGIPPNSVLIFDVELVEIGE